MSKTKVETKSADGRLDVSVSGYIGESSELFDLSLNGVKEIKFDLSGVGYINSVGVKNWIIWIRKIPESIQVEFLNCPPLIINQINMVDGFIPKNSKVTSFLVPTHCEECEFESAIKVHAGVEYNYPQGGQDARLALPELQPCSKCGAGMEIDVVESKYFHFIHRHKG